jgi:hypothetical protein
MVHVIAPTIFINMVRGGRGGFQLTYFRGVGTAGAHNPPTLKSVGVCFCPSTFLVKAEKKLYF